MRSPHEQDLVEATSGTRSLEAEHAGAVSAHRHERRHLGKPEQDHPNAEQQQRAASTDAFETVGQRNPEPGTRDGDSHSPDDSHNLNGYNHPEHD